MHLDKHCSRMVSIIIPTKDRSELLRETLHTVQSQTHVCWEALVCDDGSMDNTLAMVYRMAKTDQRIRVVPATMKSGAPARRNDGLVAAKGQYVLFLDSDDLLVPYTLQQRVKTIEADYSLDFVVTPAMQFREKPGDCHEIFDGGYGKNDLFRFLCMHYPWQTGSVLWSRRSLDRIGLWDEDLQIGQDVDYHVRALSANLRYCTLRKPDMYYRTTPPAGTTKIGRRPTSPLKQPSHERRVKRLAGLMSPWVRENPPLRRVVVGNFLWVAQNHAQAGNRDESSRLWRDARKERLINPVSWYGGCLLLWAVRQDLAALIWPIVAIVMPRGTMIAPRCNASSGDVPYRPMHCPSPISFLVESGGFSYRQWGALVFQQVRRSIKEAMKRIARRLVRSGETQGSN